MRRLLTTAFLLAALVLAGCAAPKPKYTPDNVIEAFKQAGLEAESPREMEPADYGAAPMLAEKGIRFLIPSVCADCGGRVMSFAKFDDLQTTERYYVEVGRASALMFSWTFKRDNILVQINGDLPQDQARAYEQALEDMK